jgi:chemotaxis response regulator CheB
LILDGEVRQIFQSHALEIWLTLQDGRQVTTTEPSIDDVFRVVEECGDPCAGIALATE